VKERENIQREAEVPIQIEEELKEEHEMPVLRQESDSSSSDGGDAETESEMQENWKHSQKYGRLNLFGASEMLMDGPPENTLLENYESSSEESGADSDHPMEMWHANMRSAKTMNFKIPIMQRTASIEYLKYPIVE